jgi:hypothetical protein
MTKDNRNQSAWGQACVLPVLAESSAATCSITVNYSGSNGQIIGIAIAD